jgi:hypothetical protein
MSIEILIRSVVTFDQKVVILEDISKTIFTQSQLSKVTSIELLSTIMVTGLISYREILKSYYYYYLFFIIDFWQLTN